MKPIFRWTIGNCNFNGYQALEKSIQSVLKLYGDRFDYFVCYNNCNGQIIRDVVGSKNINTIKQEWQDLPLQIDYAANQSCWGGSSLWKLCPPRLNNDVHEIVCDNDLIFLKECEEIELFLKSDKVLLNCDSLKCQGKYFHLFDSNENYNAGLFGMPPFYDFDSELLKSWQETGSFPILNQADEQGLTTYTLKKNTKIIIQKEKIPIVFSNGYPIDIKYHASLNKNEFTQSPVDFSKNAVTGYHFVVLNKNKEHLHWKKFVSFYNKNFFL
jgi:hypothetical protein